MTDTSPMAKMETEAQRMAAALKADGIEVLQALCLIVYETPDGPGMVTVSTEEAPDSLRAKMLQKALERK